MYSVTSKLSKFLLIGTLLHSASALAANPQPALQLGTEKISSQTSAQSAEQSNLRQLMAGKSQLFLTGEYISRSLPFYVMPEEAGSAAKLVLQLQTAVSVAPELSKLSVLINGSPVGNIDLKAGPKRRIEFAVPGELLNPGYNAVTLQADQRHRVDCSIDATYELWTQIDPDTSGFEFTAPRRTSYDLVNAIQLAGNKDGRKVIRVVVPNGSNSSKYEKAISLIQALTVLGNISHPAIKFVSQPENAPGINLFIGTTSELGSLVNKDDIAGGSDGVLIRMDETIRMANLILTGELSNDIDNNIRKIINQVSTDVPIGSPQGLQALTNQRGLLLEPGRNVRLRQLGFISKPFDGRFAYTQLNMTMPSDFYPGDYADIYLHLNAVYRGGLASGAGLTVRVNDKIVANIPLSAKTRGNIRDQRLPIPFSALHPGQNSLKLEARLPTALDQSCNTVAATTNGPRIFIDDNSYLEMTNYARVGQYPDISSLASNLSPKLSKNKFDRQQIFIPSRKNSDYNAAGTFIAKIAFASGEIQNYAVTNQLTDFAGSNILAFGSFDTLPSTLTAEVKLDFLNIRRVDAWNENALDKGSIQIASKVKSSGQKNDPAFNFGNIDDTNESGTLAPLIDGVQNVVQDYATRARHYLSRVQGSAVESVFGEDGLETYSPTSDAALVFAQKTSSQGGLISVIAARSMDQLEPMIDVITDRTVWTKLGGTIQSFSSTGEVIDRLDVQSKRLFQTQELTYSNSRLVLAGWLANNSSIYASLLMIAAILLGLGTYLVLRAGDHD